MASPLELLNQASYQAARRGVTYMPATRIQQRRPAPAPERIGTRDQPASTAARWLTPNMEAIANFAPPKPAAAGGGGGLGGLGWIVGKAGQGALGALSVLDYPRATVNALVSEIAPEIIQRMPDAGNYPALDTNFSWADIGRNIREHKGFGETLVEPIMGPEGSDWNIWVRRALGLAGDIATDPFTYATLGTEATAGLAARGTYLHDLQKAQEAAGRGIGTAERAIEQYAPMMARVAEQPATGYGAFAQQMIGKQLAGAEQRLPQLLEQQAALGGTDVLEKIGRQGVNVATEAQLAAMGLEPSALRFAGYAIPGTQRAAEAFGRATGPLKGRLSETALARGTRALTTRKGYFGQDMRPALERIIAGSNAEQAIEPAIASIALNQNARRVGNTFRSVATRELGRFSQEIKDLDSATRSGLIRQAEEDGVENVMTTLAPRMRKIAAELGVEIPEIQGTQYATPHVFSREAYNWMNKLRRGQDPRFDQFRRALQIKPEDLMEEGGFLQRRVLRPNADGTPLELKIGDRTIQIERGSISELEDKLGGVLRETGFQGKLYETDPIEAWRRYINATSRDVAKRKATRDAADAGFPGLFRDPGKPGAFQPYEWRDLPPVDVEGEQVQRRMIAESGKPKPEDTQFYEYKPHEQRKLRRELSSRRTAGKQQRQIVSEFGDVGTAAREQAAQQLDEITKQTWGGVQEQRMAAAEAQREAERGVRSVRGQYADLVEQRRVLQGQVDDANAEVRRLQRQIGGLTSGATRRTRARSRELLDELRNQLDIAVAKRDKLVKDWGETHTKVLEAARSAEETAFSTVKRRRASYRQHLTDKAIEAESNMGEIERAATSDLRARKGKAWVSDAEYNQLRDEVTPQAVQEYEALQQRITDLDNQQKRHLADAADSKRTADELRYRAKSRNITPDQQRLLESEAREYDKAYNNSLYQAQDTKTRLANARDEAKRTDLAKKVNKMRSYQQQKKDIANWKASPTDDVLNVSAARGRYTEAMHELDRWDADEAIMRQAGPRPTTLLSEAEQTELQAARDVLEQPKSQRYLAKRRRLDNIHSARPTEEAVQAKLAKEQAELERWIAARPELVDRVEQAQQTIKQLERKDREALARLPEPPARHEVAQQFEREAAQRMQEALKAEGTLRQTEAQAERQIGGAEAGIEQARAQLGSAESGVVRDTSAEVNAAMERLQGEDAQKLYANRQRMTDIESELADLRGKRTSPKRRATQEALNNEHTALRQWFTDNADLAERVRADEATFATGPQATRQGATSQIAFEEAAATRPRVEQAQEAIGKQREQAQQFQEEMGQIDDEIGGTVRNYVEARQDQATARARHQEIKTNLEPLERPRSTAGILEGKRQGRPTGTGMESVLAGEATPYEIQPLKRTADDIDKLIQANPTGDDELMNRAEAALSSVEQTLTKATTEGDIPAHQVNKILRAARDNKLQPVLKAQLKGAYTTVWEQGDVLVAKDLERMYFGATRAVESKLFGRTFTALTDFFKTYATLTPGFHVRNALSAIFMNSSEGVSLPLQLRALRLWREYSNAEQPLEWLAKRSAHERAAFEAVFASGAGGQFAERGVSELREGRAKFTEMLFSNPLTRGNVRLGQDWVEGPVRLALGLDSTAPRQLGGRAMNTSQALDRITRIHFDYSQVSAFDEKMKRIVPFWTFMSRNVPLQFTQMWTKPRTYLHFQSFARNFSVEPPEFMPEYLKQQGVFDTGLRTPEWMSKIPLIGPPAGMPIAAAADLPHLRLQEDLRRTAQALSGENTGQILSDVNPFFTAPFEYAMGSDFYTGKKYGPTDVSKAKGLGIPLAMLLSPVGGGEKGPGGWYLDDKTMNLLRSLNPVLERTARLVPGALAESKGGQDRQLESYLRFLGAPMRMISDQQMRSEQARRYYNALDEARHAQAVGG